MQRSILLASALIVLGSAPSLAQQPQNAYGRQVVVVPVEPRSQRQDLGGGFIEFLFGDRGPQPQSVAPLVQPPPVQEPQPLLVNNDPGSQTYADPGTVRRAMDPRLLKQEVEYRTKEAPGTVVIDTPNHFLYLVEADGKALRYGVGVGRPGFTWSGEHKVSAKREWPEWRPPDEMLQRQPYLPRLMPGGPTNPLGARALYLGSTLYRIHGSNEPWTIGQNVSSGCIRMRNEDVIDLYERVPVGAKVVVI
jgi:lipoprotein-anchoring transpeptidase ErfK/SrfK